MSSDQPSTRTNIMILNGIDIVVGGSIIIPIDISVDATTISMTRNGIYSKNPIWKPVFSSLSMNAGTTVVNGTFSINSSSFCDSSSSALSVRFMKNDMESFEVFLSIHVFIGFEACPSASTVVYSPFLYGTYTVSFISANTGDITKSVRNSDSPTSTWLGGVC